MFPCQTYRILAVDDVLDNLFILETVLTAEGYDVEIADCGKAALAKVKADPPDLVLLDVMMPDISGYEVAHQIRQDLDVPQIPILMLTAHDEAIARQGLSSGANAFIRKPIDFDELLDCVKVFLPQAENQPMSLSGLRN